MVLLQVVFPKPFLMFTCFLPLNPPKGFLTPHIHYRFLALD